MSRVIYPPVTSAEYADRVARAVERGTLQIMSHWSCRAACQSELDRYHVGRGLLPMQGVYSPTAAIVEIAEDEVRLGSPSDEASGGECTVAVRRSAMDWPHRSPQAEDSGAAAADCRRADRGALRLSSAEAA
jgi:hypothetical protein